MRGKDKIIEQFKHDESSYVIFLDSRRQMSGEILTDTCAVVRLNGSIEIWSCNDWSNSRPTCRLIICNP